MASKAFTPPGFGSLNDNSMLKIADFMEVCFLVFPLEPICGLVI